MSSKSDLIAADRESVLQDYAAAKAKNYRRFKRGDDQATEEYIFPNQIEDATKIVDMFYKKKRRVIIIQKKTKVGADGLMVECAKLMTTHPDDDFVVNLDQVRFITGMSNAGWEKDMIDKAPDCFKDKIFHHGKLSRADLMNMKNALIIIDEIDTGDKEFQVLHRTLMEAGILDVKHMEENNNRFIFISATMIREIYEVYKWGDLHELYTMTIPHSYIGHKDFLEKGIVKEFYPIKTSVDAEKWVQEDIINQYSQPCICQKCNTGNVTKKNDYRVHIIRAKDKNVNVIQNACVTKGIAFRNHTSTDRLTDEEKDEFFKKPLTNHIVLVVKGFFRRANLIPNAWKLRIGSVHEYHTVNVDNNVQIQGLVGRMTGYWRDDIEKLGHTTGPYRTSIQAIEEYEKAYLDPFGKNSYKTAGFNKTKKGKVTAKPTMLAPRNILNLEPVDLPDQKEDDDIIEHPTSFNTQKEANVFLTAIFKKKCNVTSFTGKDHEANSKFIMTTRLTRHYKKNMDDLRDDDRLIKEIFDKIKLGTNISRGKGQHYMVYPVYATINSVPGDVRYYVRYLKPKLVVEGSIPQNTIVNVIT
jgi:hypothetical protein